MDRIRVSSQSVPIQWEQLEGFPSGAGWRPLPRWEHRLPRPGHIQQQLQARRKALAMKPRIKRRYSSILSQSRIIRLIPISTPKRRPQMARGIPCRFQIGFALGHITLWGGILRRGNFKLWPDRVYRINWDLCLGKGVHFSRRRGFFSQVWRC